MGERKNGLKPRLVYCKYDSWKSYYETARTKKGKEISLRCVRRRTVQYCMANIVAGEDNDNTLKKGKEDVLHE